MFKVIGVAESFKSIEKHRNMIKAISLFDTFQKIGEHMLSIFSPVSCVFKRVGCFSRCTMIYPHVY